MPDALISAHVAVAAASVSMDATESFVAAHLQFCTQWNQSFNQEQSLADHFARTHIYHSLPLYQTNCQTHLFFVSGGCHTAVHTALLSSLGWLGTRFAGREMARRGAKRLSSPHCYQAARVDLGDELTSLFLVFYYFL